MGSSDIYYFDTRSILHIRNGSTYSLSLQNSHEQSSLSVKSSGDLKRRAKGGKDWDRKLIIYTYHFIWTSHASSSFYALAFACASYATETIKNTTNQNAVWPNRTCWLKQLAGTLLYYTNRYIPLLSCLRRKRFNFPPSKGVRDFMYNSRCRYRSVLETPLNEKNKKSRSC